MACASAAMVAVSGFQQLNQASASSFIASSLSQRRRDENFWGVSARRWSLNSSCSRVSGSVFLKRRNAYVRCPLRALGTTSVRGGKKDSENPDEDAKKEVEEETEETEKEEGQAASDTGTTEEAPLSVTQSLLRDFREALASNNEAALADLEAQLEAISSVRDSLAEKVATMKNEVSTGKDRFLRLNADFDNYRKRAERDRLATAGNVRGEVIESLLPMVDNFERAKTSIKTETEGEQKIDNSYQSIYKQFVEIMKSLGVIAVDTVGKEFDPNVHEAIMREESTEFADGVVTQEFRRGFAIGDRLLRPAMVKVSSGPGPAPETDVPVEESLNAE